MATMLSGFRLYTLKGETTEGTDPTPVVGTDDLVVLDSSPLMEQGVEKTAVSLATPTGVEYADVVTRKAASWSPQLPLYGIGLSTGVIQLPIWASALLGSCHDIAVGSSDTSSADLTANFRAPTTVDDSDASSDNAQSFTVYEYAGSAGALDDGTRVRSRMLGCRVAGFSLRFAVGEIVTITPNILGSYTLPTSSTTNVSGFDFDGALTDWIVPNAMQCTLTPSGGSAIAMNLSELTLDVQFGGEHIAADSSSGTGVVGVAQRNVRVTGTFNPLIDSTDIATWWSTIVDTNTECALAMTANGAFPSTRSGNTGYGVKLAIPALTFNGRHDTGGPALRIGGPFHAGGATAAGAPYTLSIQ